jgi:methenyltetrahydrofolate cyclohydrolase
MAKRKSQSELAFELGKDYLTLPARELLEEYGAGSHVPGSGSAAALSALIAVELMTTVCKPTLKKLNYKKSHRTMEYIRGRIEKEFKPRLIELFKQDIEAFNKVSVYRTLRDKSDNPNERRRLNAKSLREQKQATEIPLEICMLSLELLPLGLAVFEEGFKSARGDSGVAISNLLSAISGGLFIIFLNLKSFKKSQWLEETKQIAEDLTRQFYRYQSKAFAKVLELYEEGLLDSDKQLRFPLPSLEIESS